jgi:RimJ/RimL family protein N-acetyltransferase
MNIRLLEADEWSLKRDLRLAALKESPAAFASSFDREVDRSEDEWRAWPKDGAYFAAFDDLQLPIGIAGCWMEPGQRSAVHLISMWVAPSARRTGTATLLTAAVLKWARERNARRVELEVAIGNDAARRVYLRSGFTVTSRKPTGSCAAVLELLFEEVRMAARPA